MSTNVLFFQQSSVSSKMKGLNALFTRLMSDIVRHHEGGCSFINALKQHEHMAWKGVLPDQMAVLIKASADNLCGYVQSSQCGDVLAQSSEAMCQQIRCLADYSCECIDLPRQFGTHGYPEWMVSAGVEQKVNHDELLLQEDVPTVTPLRSAGDQLEQ